jgi:4-hydroxybenzoate polyprenyltransferase
MTNTEQLTEAGVDVAASCGPSLARDLLALARPGQWAKNLLVIPLPLLDSRLWAWPTVGRIVWSVVVFTLASVLVYTLNDIADRGRDRIHPLKRHRPLASGRIGMPAACGLIAAVGLVLIALLAAEPITMSWPVPVYLAMNVAYSWRLKHVALVDVYVVAAGFVLRLVAGYLATGQEISGWLALCVFSLCLLLSLGKRRHEMAAVDATHRPALGGYSLPLLDQLIGLTAVLTVTSYLLHLRADAAVGAGAAAAAMFSAPFAIFGIARYLQLLFVERGGGNPVRALLRDRAMAVNAALWAGVIIASLLLAHKPS